MERQIPIYFDSVIIDSPFQTISENNPHIGRAKVRVFTKYANRNGSYITDNVAEQLINSAVQGNTPVVGFFDPETKTWASHTGPTLANAYGYVENVLGWDSFTDTDGVSRDYAIFSVILFTDYFEEANQVLGQNQSMELDPNSITGDWGEINNDIYYIYKTAKILGFCIIGSHEPCFSVSSFFSKNDDLYNSQYEKFSSLLSDLKAQVEEVENFNKGGEQLMDNEEVKTVVESEDVENIEQQQEEETTVEDNSTFENNQTVEETESVQEIESEPEPEIDEKQQQFEQLQQQFSDLQKTYEELQNQFSEAQTTFSNEIDSLRAANEDLQKTIQSYKEQIMVFENQQKESLIEKYEKSLDSEKISEVRAKINDMSYDKLESELAIAFARANLKENDNETDKVFVPEQKSQFALLMEKYRKN